VTLGIGLGQIEPKFKMLKMERDPAAAYSRLLPVAERRGNNSKRLRTALETQFAPSEN